MRTSPLISEGGASSVNTGYSVQSHTVFMEYTYEYYTGGLRKHLAMF